MNDNLLSECKITIEDYVRKIITEEYFRKINDNLISECNHTTRLRFVKLNIKVS